MLNPFEELRFWTGIMRDHGEFMILSFSFNEQEALQNAHFYRDAFSRLHEQSKALSGSKDPAVLGSLLQENLNILANFINFKKQLLARLLQCKLNTSLPPTFYNHMINEAMEFYKALCRLMFQGASNPVLENLNLHRVWLPDAAGHAATIACELDPVEKALIKEAHEFEKSFNHLKIKADELAVMLCRTCLSNGALELLNEEVLKKLESFISYLAKIRDLRARCKALGTLKPLMPDHMIREENYYMNNILEFYGKK